MRRILIAALTLGLVAGALVVPASAKKAKPQPVTFYFHGPLPLGEADYVETTANGLQSIPDGFQIMDTTEPSSPAPNSMEMINYVQGPNRNCNGNALLPTWQGQLVGKVSGDMKVYLNAVSTPAIVVVDVFADTTGGCTSTVTGAAEYIDPVASVEVELAPGVGENEIIIKNVNFPVASHIVIMVSPGQMVVNGESKHDALSHVRVLYDSADFASRVEFLCRPTSGKSCVPAS